ncbi:MAG: DNRLRE domain-containing protein, partial [Candidatus Cloacimonadales bacterium]
AKVPVLRFDYNITTDNEEREYKRNCFKDTYIVNDKQDEALTWDNIEYSNMLPRRSFLKFDVDTANLVDQTGNSLDEFQIKHLTVNKAYLRLYLKENSFFTGKRNSYLSAYRVTKEIDGHQAIGKDNLEYLVNSGTASKIFIAEADTTQFIDVKITPLMQGFISGEKENFGIVLRSPYQSTNFDVMEFHASDAEDVTLRPKVHFIYTLPLD